MSRRVARKVDGVWEYRTIGDPVALDESGKIAVEYLPPGSTGGLLLGETSDTAHRGDHGAAAYSHSQSAHVATDDPRLSDARTPTTHSHSGYVADDDARLSDARTPTTHSHDYEAPGAAAAAVSAHEGASDPHPAYLLESALPAIPAVANAGEVADCSTVAEADGTSPRYARADHVHKYVDTSGGGATPAWHGTLYGAFGNCDPHRVLDMLYNNPVNATPTNVTVSVARLAYFRPPANITVNKIRWFGVGATTNVYRLAIYNADTLARLTDELAFTTAAQTWGSVSASALALTAGQLYFIAVSVNVTGTTAGCACLSSSTGRIGVLPKSWPGSLDIDLASPIIEPRALAQFAVTTGALPTTAPTIAAQAAWTGGMPAFFLDSNNA